MMRSVHIGGHHVLVALVGILCLCSPALAQNEEIATLEAFRGDVTIVRLGTSETPSASMALQRDDIVLTKRGRATVRFSSDGSVLRVGPDSRVQINESATDRDITMFFGRLWAHVVRWQDRATRFRSGSTIAAVRGTEVSLGVAVDGDETQVAVLEGNVETETDAGTLSLTGGQSAIGRTGVAPQRGVRVRPQDAVQWALYYVPVIYMEPSALGQGTWQDRVRASREAYNGGDLQRALDSLSSVDAASVQDPRFFTYRASLLLASGGVEEAEADIDRALALAANDSNALALQTIIAVANNETDNAAALGQRAVSADPSSATAHIGLSYAQQAQFDIEGARASLETAVEQEPNDALAWARLAEIRSAQGLLGPALDAAERAVELEPNLSRTQTVLGYAYLARVQTTRAREAFERAIALDQDDPLPRLGHGLARIRDGELTEGNEELEVAVSLDPAQAVVRSYLGKGYFEAKRMDLIEREYDVAKESDPNDPTPWFYDAINKQTTNRPVEALESLETAIDLNDNRAVYRSRLLLDSDLAARSASQARIYTDLGFQDRALLEGWTSVNTDPTNFSAHRFLADSYAARPRHEIARVSELFQSQMLQPLNTTPIQPSLGESNLFLISAQGPGVLSFNEFNPLFNRDQVNLQGSFMVGEDDNLAGEAIVSGIYKKFSFSAGYSDFHTDGFRENNQQDDQIANAFVQAELAPSTSVQAEVRYRKLDAGDLSLNFFENDFNPNATRLEERTNVRVGLRQDIGPAFTFLASYMHSDRDALGEDPDPVLGVDINLDQNEKADSVEGQLLFRSPFVKVVGGAGYFDIDTAEILSLEVPEQLTSITTSDFTDKHKNLYAYSYVTLPAGLTLTLGVSADLFDGSGESLTEVSIPGLPPIPPTMDPAPVLGEQDHVNPKLGLVWAAQTGTTFRVAWFETQTRTLITDQTLEPTQVAGFNQFFDEPSATEARNYGVGVDQKFGGKVFAGAEYIWRELTVPVTTFQLGPGPSMPPDEPPPGTDGPPVTGGPPGADGPPVTGGPPGVDGPSGPDPTVTVERVDADERLSRAYLSVAPHPSVVFGAEYRYEKFERPQELAAQFGALTTHRVPLSARYFHPSGISAFASVTYFDQEGEFVRFGEVGPELVPGQRSFWVANAGVRYRLPKRYGFLVAGVNNLTDERSTYQSTDPNNLTIRPGRVVFARMVLAFP